MHHTKSAARSLAWRDEKNPFARSKQTSRRTDSALSDAENGNGSFSQNRGLSRTITDDPRSHGSAQSRMSEVHTNSRSTYSTAPDAHSRQRQQEAGDDVNFAPTLSPAATSEETHVDNKSPGMETEKVPTNKSMTGAYDHEATEPKKRGFFAKMFKSKGKSKKKDDDEEEGKGGKQNPHFTVWNQIRGTLFNSWINILLIFSPVGIAIHYAGVTPVAVFVCNFVAIIPLAALLSYATEEIALRTGEVLGGLLNASFGNAVELIVSIIALAKNQVLIVQTSLIGSILSNLLLVMGMCFFAGGFNRIEQEFNMTVAQTAASLLFLAVSSLIIPTAFDEWANTNSTDRTDSSAPAVNGVVPLSRATAILLLVVYACYLFFQLKSHTKMYNAAGGKNETRTDIKVKTDKMKSYIPGKNRAALRKRRQAGEDDDSTSRDSIPGADEDRRESVTPQRETENGDKEQEEEREEPQLAIWVAIGLLAASTVLVAINAECLVDSINAITCGSKGISKNFVGLILLPIVGNAAEHATAVTVAIKDKMDLAIGVAVGSSMQIALLVLPFMVVLGWIMGKDDMTLYFDGYQIALLFVAVLLVNYLIQDGKSHWLEGVLLMTLYVIIAVSAWYYPVSESASDCPA